MSKQTFTTQGDITGTCGHQHRSLRTAMQCAARHHDGCASQGGYSDRHVRRGDGSVLSEDEREELDRLEDAAALA